MHFIVFIPDCNPADLEKTAKVAGLNPILGGHDVLPNMPGPNGLTGLMIGHLSPSAPHMHYEASKQLWIPSVEKDEHGKPRYLVGIWKHDPPKEVELRRFHTQDGVFVRFGPDEPDAPTEGCAVVNSERWKIPTPKTVDARAVYNDDGTLRWEPLRRFSWVVDEAQKLRDEYLAELSFKEMLFRDSPGPQIQWLIKLMQINYRMLPEVAAYLDLFAGSKTHLIDVVLATLNLYRKEPGE